jgi:carboxymethylenebutenolidase
MATMSDSMRAETVLMPGDGGDDVEAYLVRPDEPVPRGGVVVIHHLPGYDRGTKEITRRFAELGYDAICVNLYYREAPGSVSSGTAPAAGTASSPPATSTWTPAWTATAPSSPVPRRPTSP